MNAHEITDPALRDWALARIETKLTEMRAAKTSAETLRDVWRTFDEAEWGAFRAQVELGAEAERRGIERAEIDFAVARRLARLPPLERNGHQYSAPWSRGLDVAVLRDLLGVRPPPARGTIVEEVEWPHENPPSQGELPR